MRFFKMFWIIQASDKILYHHKLKQLVKQKKNNEIKDIIKTINSSDALHDPTGTTLLHMTAKYNNLDLMTFLLKSRVDINAQDTFGTTPLMTAVLHGNYEVVELLLANDADYICIADGQNRTALKLALVNKVPKYVVKYFLRRLKNGSTYLDSDTIADVLIKNNFPLKYLVLIEDTQLTRTILEKKESISYDESLDLIRRAIKSTHLGNMQTLAMLMQYGPGNNARQQIFVQEMSYVIESAFPSKKYLTLMMRHLMNFNAINETFLRYLELIFYTHRKYSVLLLLQCKIDVCVKKIFDQDLMVYLFGNKKLDAIEIVKQSGRQFDVEAKGTRGLNALHYAMRNKLNKNVRYLLDTGADPNGRDDLGITPLFYACDVECIQLLLESGADVQLTKSDGSSILHTLQCPIMLQIVIAHIAIIEADGKAVQQTTRDTIEKNASLSNFYNKCRQQVNWMKKQRVLKYATLFTIVSKTAEQLVPYMRNLTSEPPLLHFKLYKILLHWYYCFTLKRRLKRATKIYKLKCTASRVISKNIKVFGADSVVIEKIVGYLTYKDLRVFN